MNRNKQRLFILTEVLLDVCLIPAVYWLSYWVQFHLLGNRSPLRISEYQWPLRFLIGGILILYYAFGLYRPMALTGRLKEAKQIIKANLICLLALLTVLFVLSTNSNYPWAVYFSRRMAVRFSAYYVICSIAWRNLYRLVLLQMRKSNFNRRHVLIVGYGRAAEGYIDRIASHRQWGLEIVGVLDDNVEVGQEYRGVKIIGTTAALSEILEKNAVEEIVISLGLPEYGKLEAIVKKCEKSGVHTVFVPDYNHIIPTKPYTEDLLGLPLIHIRHVPLMEGGNFVIKRLMDIVGSLICIVLFSPVMLITAILVKVTSPGNVIFKQERVGLHNRPFQMYKFRSMTVQPPDEEVDKWTTKGDARVTAVGKIIRKTSIDELPQLFNVLKGDMSLVGPRPERPFFVEKFKEEIPRYMVKHQVRPGMTGWAQVNGLRGDTSIRRRIELDLYYIENWSILFDIKILFLTVFRGFVNPNAY